MHKNSKSEKEDKTTTPSLEVLTAAGQSSQSISYLGNLLRPSETVLDEKGGNPKLYAQILRDDQVKSTLQQRFTGLTSKEWEVVPGGEDAIDVEAADFLREQMENIGWTRKVGKMVYGIFYGYAVAEILWEINDDNKLAFKDIAVRKRHRFKFDVQGHLRLITLDHPQGKALPDRKMWVYSTGADNDDQPYGQALAHWLYWPCLFKREGIKFWMMFLDKFGSPTPVGHYPANATDKEKEQLLAATQAFQQESGIIIPEGMLIELIEATRGGRVDYAIQYKVMDAAIAKVVLSQTMTTDDGSSLSQAQVHGGVKDDVVEADAEDLCDSFNRGPVKWITEFNFPGAKMPKVRFITEDAVDLDKAADRDKKLDELGYPPTESHILETYGDGYEKREPEDGPVNIRQEIRGDNDQSSSFREHSHEPDDIENFSTTVGTKNAELLETAFQSIIGTINDADNLEDLRDQLIGSLEGMTTDELQEHLAQATFFARTVGDTEADAE